MGLHCTVTDVYVTPIVRREDVKKTKHQRCVTTMIAHHLGWGGKIHSGLKKLKMLTLPTRGIMQVQKKQREIYTQFRRIGRAQLLLSYC